MHIPEGKFSLETILSNIEYARENIKQSKNIKLVALVSGSESAKNYWQKRLGSSSKHIFNSDGSTVIHSLREKAGSKEREGNFLGTLLAYARIKELSRNTGVDHTGTVTLIGMLFGRGERMSPFTQIEANCKPAISGISSPGGIHISEIEEALMFFSPVARFLEDRGFRGILDKWGDETEIASIDLAAPPEDENCFREYDIVKLISKLKVTDSMAKARDWVVSDGNSSLVTQLPRNNREVLIRQLGGFGIKPGKDGEVYAGVSLGPVAVSYDVLDIMEEVFADDIRKEGVHLDFDPYLIMAFTLSDDEERWKQALRGDDRLKTIAGPSGMMPDLHDKARKVREIFRKKHGRELNLKTVDLGEDVFWMDVGQHEHLRKKYLALADKGPAGVITRRLEGVPEDRDENENIIINSRISEKVLVTGSVIVNSVITGTGRVNNSVIKDSVLNDVSMDEAFSILSHRTGRTVLGNCSGIYRSFGSSLDDLELEKAMRHGTLLTETGSMDMMVSEKTELRDKDNTYNTPVYGNKLSFSEAYDVMERADFHELEEKRREHIDAIGRIDRMNKKFKRLKFGTSGLRDTVENMTDMEVYINTRGFVEFLRETGDIEPGNMISVAGDLRPSTPRLMTAVSRAIEDSGYGVDHCGFIPSPAVTLRGLTGGTASVMVTGSHIPADRNGIKFNKRSGEVLKSDEKAILENVAKIRKAVYGVLPEETLFDEAGMFKTDIRRDLKENEAAAGKNYIKRYLDAFPGDALKGKKVFLYQHSAVGRDIISEIFSGLGAQVIYPKDVMDIKLPDRGGDAGTKAVSLRSDEFIPVDTEKVSPETNAVLKEAAGIYTPDAVISTDGDSDRPLLADENGDFLTGDKLGALAAKYLKPDFAAVPVSTNDAVMSLLQREGINVVLTRIGSPHVIKAMNDHLAKDPAARVVSWEANGGFLLGSDWDIPGGGRLAALPTRDAVLPLIAVLLLSLSENKSLSKLISGEFPPRYNTAGVYDGFEQDLDLSKEDALTLMKGIVPAFSPVLDDTGVISVDYASGTAFKLIDETFEVEKVSFKSLSDRDRNEWTRVRDEFSRIFREKGFSGISAMNILDGIKINFENGEVSHLRPSGNAPEFRNYSIADTVERAKEIVDIGIKEIIPELARRVHETV